MDDLAQGLEDELVELDLAPGLSAADPPRGADRGETGGPEIGRMAERMDAVGNSADGLVDLRIAVAEAITIAQLPRIERTFSIATAVRFRFTSCSGVGILSLPSFSAVGLRLHIGAG